MKDIENTYFTIKYWAFKKFIKCNFTWEYFLFRRKFKVQTNLKQINIGHTILASLHVSLFH